MSYDSKKSAGRSTREPKQVNLAPAQSQQERGTGSAARRVTVPATASNQLRLQVVGDLKTPLNSYSSILLEAVANPAGAQQAYSTKSPKRPLAKDKL